MERKIITELREWKNLPSRKPLIMLGARQVGKTWILKYFGETDFENFAYVNCDENPLAKELFATDYNIERIILTLKAITNVDIKAGKTLIILDEIQEAKRGLHSLKYFCENAPQYHVVAAGSLLGITLTHGESYPVGKVDLLKMYPLDFSEFLLAMGENALHETLLAGNWTTINALKTKFVQLLRQYYFVGGMPEVVQDYVKKRNLQTVRKKQHSIIDAYRRDISKHATSRESMRIAQILDSLPSQLAKENKKFIFSVIKKGARATDFELAIQWLVDAGIVYKVPRVKEIRMPLKFYEDFSAFKLFVLDCGLLGCMIDSPASQMLIGDNVFREFKGAFSEQFILQQLVAQQITPYYWSNDSTPAEIDFVIQTDERVIPIEVKAEENVRSQSLSTYIKNHPNDHLKGVRFSMKGYCDQEWMENFPLFAVGVFSFSQTKQLNNFS